MRLTPPKLLDCAAVDDAVLETCPVHGKCTCNYSKHGCPLHDPNSPHQQAVYIIRKAHRP